MSRKIIDTKKLNALFNATGPQAPEQRPRASNFIFATGEASPIPMAAGDRRYAVITEPQTRLVLGPFQLVLAEHDRGRRDGTPAFWALPGGGRATTAQLLVLARRNGWKRPAPITVTVRRRVVSQET